MSFGGTEKPGQAGGKFTLGIALSSLLFLGACDGGDVAQEPGTGSASTDLPEALNMRLVGLHGLDGRSSYQPIPHRMGDRQILFVGHHSGKAVNSQSGLEETNGMSIVDVTDPSDPVVLAHVPPTGAEASGTQHVQVCDGSVLPGGEAGKTYLLRTNGQISHEILDVTDPQAPAFVTTVLTTGHTDDGRQNTHKSWWVCETGIGYLLSTPEGWHVPRVLQAYDLSNPAEPRHIRDFAIDGMQPGGEGDYTDVIGVHSPLVVDDRIFLAYGSGTNGILQILDRDKFLNGDPGADDPFAPTSENLLYPQISRLDLPTFWGTHTAKPIYGMEIEDYADDRANNVRDFLVMVSESLVDYCQETRHAVFFVDITQEGKPLPVSNYQAREEPGDFCNRGGRFGPHAQHDSFNPAFMKKVLLVSYFNAGVRAIDIRDPFRPTEIGYFIPEVNDKTQPSCRDTAGGEECKVAIQTNNINIDDRGYIYLLDRAGSGLHIVQLTGAAHDIVGQP